MKRLMIGLVAILGFLSLNAEEVRDQVTAPPSSLRLFDRSDQVAQEDILAYLPGGRVLAVGTESKALRGSPWRLESAITPALREAAIRIGGHRLVPVVIGLAPGVSLQEVGTALEAGGGTVVWTNTSAVVPRVGLTVPPQNLGTTVEGLKALEGMVVFADIQPGARLQNYRSARMCQGGDLLRTPIFDRGLLGNNQIIGVMDTGIDADSCFFEDPDQGLPAINGSNGTEIAPEHRKILAVNFWWDGDWPDPGPLDWDSQGHGTHTAGSAAGDFDDWGSHQGNDGMAPAARLVIQDGGYEVDACADLPGLGCPVQPLGPMLEQAWAQGARIHSNSWGDAEEIWPLNRYTEPTADIDRFVRQHPEMVVVAAAGNAGSLGDDTVISPSTGKNVVSVGALVPADLNPLCPASFSSRGWTHDGRIKPDVMAPGSLVISADTNFLVGAPGCRVVPKSGTSMATPTVAGLVALVRQYFMEGWHIYGRRAEDRGVVPSAALVKAVLVASAVDLTKRGCQSIDPIPSRDQGWGMVQLDRALWFEGDDHRMSIVDHADAFDSEADGFEMAVDIDQTTGLKVVLSWIDVPSTSTANYNLVNDLDLEVEGPDGTFRGNLFAGGRSVTGGTADRRNNVEVVLLPNAGAGSWVIRVRPHAVVEGSQGFALVVLGEEGVRVRPAPRNPGDGRSRP